jgi:integrase/recombinase XerD
VEKFIQEFISEYTKQGKSQNTKDAYERDIKDFLEYYEFAYDTEFDGNIITMDLKEFKKELENKIIVNKKTAERRKLNLTTINRKLLAVKKFADFLHESGYAKTPVKIVQIKTSGKYNHIEIVEHLDLRKLKRTFYAENNKRDIAIFELIRGTGVRASELCNLTLQSLSLTERNGKENKSFIRVKGKGEKYRDIPLNVDVRNAINEYLKVRPTSSLDNLFLGQRGPITRAALNKILEKYSGLALIKHVNPHMLRHNYGTELVKNGTDLKTVMELMGHADIKITIEYYVNSSYDDKRRANDKLAGDYEG